MKSANNKKNIEKSLFRPPPFGGGVQNFSPIPFGSLGCIENFAYSPLAGHPISPQMKSAQNIKKKKKKKITLTKKSNPPPFGEV